MHGGDPPASKSGFGKNCSLPPGVNRYLRPAVELLAWAIEAADEDRSDGWYLRETDHGLRLMAGRLIACRLNRSRLRISLLMAPVPDQVLGALGGERVDEFKWLPGGEIIGMPLDKASTAFSLLKDAMDAFIDGAMTRVRRSVSLEEHTPEAVYYLSAVLGRELPQPEPGSDITPADETTEIPESRRSGNLARAEGARASAHFENGQRSIASLISDIERQVIALPDLQDPFIWEDTKVRDLFELAVRGILHRDAPVWHHYENEKDARALGEKRRAFARLPS